MINYTSTAQEIANNLYASDHIADYDMTGDGNGNNVIATLTLHDGSTIALSTEQDEDGESYTYTRYTDGEESGTDGGPIEDAETDLLDLLHR